MLCCVCLTIVCVAKTLTHSAVFCAAVLIPTGSHPVSNMPVFPVHLCLSKPVFIPSFVKYPLHISEPLPHPSCELYFFFFFKEN